MVCFGNACPYPTFKFEGPVRKKLADFCGLEAAPYQAKSFARIRPKTVVHISNGVAAKLTLSFPRSSARCVAIAAGRGCQLGGASLVMALNTSPAIVWDCWLWFDCKPLTVPCLSLMCSS